MSVKFCCAPYSGSVLNVFMMMPVWSAYFICYAKQEVLVYTTQGKNLTSSEQQLEIYPQTGEFLLLRWSVLSTESW